MSSTVEQEHDHASGQLVDEVHALASAGDYRAAPTLPSVGAGKVTFARDVGRVPRELMAERRPMRLDSPMTFTVRS